MFIVCDYSNGGCWCSLDTSLIAFFIVVALVTTSQDSTLIPAVSLPFGLPPRNLSCFQPAKAVKGQVRDDWKILPNQRGSFITRDWMNGTLKFIMGFCLIHPPAFCMDLPLLPGNFHSFLGLSGYLEGSRISVSTFCFTWLCLEIIEAKKLLSIKRAIVWQSGPLRSL